MPLSSRSHKYMVAITTIALIIFLVVIALPSISAEHQVSNERDGDLVVFNQDYSAMPGVPRNVFLQIDVAPFQVENVRLQHADEMISASFVKNSIGNVFIAGLSPAIVTNITIDMTFTRSHWLNEAYVYAGNAWVILKLLNESSGVLRISSLYHGEELERNSVDVPIDIQAGDHDRSARFKLTICTNNLDLTNTIFLNGEERLTSPIYSGRMQSLPSVYEPFTAPLVWLSAYIEDVNSTAEIGLHSITQTVPRNKLVTPLPDPTIAPFGLDGPHLRNTIEKGIAMVEEAGGRGTIWADVVYLASYSEHDLAWMKGLIENGWELGIHFSAGLTGLDMDEAIALMEDEYERITSIFDQPPTTWCSLQNDDDVAHAEWAYEHLGLIWRNGWNGAAMLSNVSNIQDANIDFWIGASAAGASIMSFTHQLDLDPAIPFSICPSNYSNILDGYAASGIRMVGWYEYWISARNSYFTEISDLRMRGEVLTFTVTNEGGLSRLFVALPHAVTILGDGGQEIDFETVEGGVIVDVGAGSYEVISSGTSSLGSGTLLGSSPAAALIIIILLVAGISYLVLRRR